MEYSANDFRYYQENSLSHHGILGMKWGVRRYQNEDGTLTEAGRKRYGVDRDIDDKSLVNAAKIRKGEALRRYDVAKRNNPTNSRRLMELQSRVKAAKRAEREAKTLQKGQKLLAKGQTISKNALKSAMGYGAAYLGTIGMKRFLNERMRTLQSEGRWTPAHTAVAQKIFNYTAVGLNVTSALYDVKNQLNNFYIRRARNTYASARTIGSTEYRDVVERRKKK